MNDWTNDIKKLMDGYEVKAPDGLLEEVKGRLASLPPAPSKGGGDAEVRQYQADSKAKVVEKGGVKAKIVPFWRYRRIAAAAAVAVIAVSVCWKLLPKISKEREPLALSSTSHRHAGASSSSAPSSVSTSAPSSVSTSAPSSASSSSSSTLSPSSFIAMLTPHVDEGSAFGSKSSSQATDFENVETASGNSVAPSPAPSYKKRAAKERRQDYQSFDNGYDLAYAPSARNTDSWTVGGYYGGASGSGSSLGPGMAMMASDAEPYGMYSADMASADKLMLTATTKKKAHHKQPVKAGVSVGYRINNRWSVQTGVTYSYLSSDFTSDYAPNETQKLHYVGVPLTASYDIVKSRKASVYVTAGGEVEKLVKGKTSMENGEEHDVKEHRPQWSVKAAVGGAYHITPTLSVYVEPGVSHHFDNHSTVENVYKDRPTSFSLNMGFRVNLNEK